MKLVSRKPQDSKSSKLPVSFGTNLSPEPDFINRDGMGYFPDIWVNPNDALDYAVQFEKKYLH